MDTKFLKGLLEQVHAGRMEPDAAMHALKNLPFEDLGYARIDNHRCIRNGVPEVIYTRAGREVYEAIREFTDDCIYHEMARIVVVKPREVEQKGHIAVVSAGTSDIPVAEEAAITAEVLGNRVTRIYDVGVAGIHRLLAVTKELFTANVAVVVAGMEGALASVVGGLVSCPVPTSVGYGASFGGVAALLSMLNSCASGVSVVNIDNGFGAGYQACLINRVAFEEKDRAEDDAAPVKLAKVS